MYITICIFNAVILISEGYSGSITNTIVRENSSICVSCFNFFKVNHNTTVRENSSILIVIYNREVDSKDIIKIIIKTIIQIIMETKNIVTAEEVKENMKDVRVRTVIEFGRRFTYVAVRMKNGFTLRESTNCVDPENYSEEIGKEICLKRIETKIWFLLGYALQDKMFKEKNAHKTFKHFQKVLVKVMNDDDNLVWVVAIYSHYNESKGKHYFSNLQYSSNLQWTDDDSDIIPFEGNEDKLGQIAE